MNAIHGVPDPFVGEEPLELDPPAVAARLAAGEPLRVLDVREADEVAVAAFPGAIHVPLSGFPSGLDRLDPDTVTVVLCHHGVRSAWVAAALRRAGWPRVINLAGGIDAWSRQVDPAVPRY